MAISKRQRTAPAAAAADPITVRAGLQQAYICINILTSS